MSKLHRPITVRWIATWLAVFGLVFAPTLSRAMAVFGGGVDWVEVCSSQGSRLVPVQGRSSAKPESDADVAGQALLHQLTSHCPLCSIASGAGLAPPPVPFSLWLIPSGAPSADFLRAPPSFAITPRTQPQPRAPPLSA